jgi:hypothetical protein
MMQSAQARHRDYGSVCGWLWLDRSAGGRIFAKAIVNSIFVVVVHAALAKAPGEREDYLQSVHFSISAGQFKTTVIGAGLVAEVISAASIRNLPPSRVTS